MEISTQQRKKDVNSLYPFMKNINRNHAFFGEYCLIYSFTNEIIRNIFQNINTGNTALSVLSSGDQVFELIMKGYFDIHTFDINRYSEYYALGLKMAAIENLSYHDFLRLFTDKYSSIQNVFSDLIKEMPMEYQGFWQQYQFIYKDVLEAQKLNSDQEIVRNQKSKIYLTDLLSWDFNMELFWTRSTYLTGEYNYELLKKLLPYASIKFENCDILDILKNNFKYDLIYISNVLEYVSNFYDEDRLLKGAYNNLLKNKGQLVSIFQKGTGYIPYDFKKVTSLYEGIDKWDYSIIQKSLLRRIRLK